MSEVKAPHKTHTKTIFERMRTITFTLHFSLEHMHPGEKPDAGRSKKCSRFLHMKSQNTFKKRRKRKKKQLAGPQTHRGTHSEQESVVLSG